MKESYIKKKVLDENAREGYTHWTPAVARSVYVKEKDIFSVFDGVFVKGHNQLRWIQWTTYGNMAARKKKVIAFFLRANVFLEGAQIWGYHKEKHQFRKVLITPSDVEQEQVGHQR